MNNCQVHSANALRQFCNENSLVTVPHPPYSPDLAPFDFWFFDQIKTSLAGRVFNDVDEPLEPAIGFLNEIWPSELQLVFHHWIKRVKWILANNGCNYCCRFRSARRACAAWSWVFT
jgi:transposase